MVFSFVILLLLLLFGVNRESYSVKRGEGLPNLLPRPFPLKNGKGGFSKEKTPGTRLRAYYRLVKLRWSGDGGELSDVLSLHLIKPR